MNCTTCVAQCGFELAVAAEEPLPLYVSIPVILCLVLLSGLFSGLTLGLMGLDVIGLQIVMKGDNVEMARCAEKIAPIREKGNMLLCTLLLGNVAVNSGLSILTAEIFSGTVGFLASTGLIVVFGEILPQATCSRYALQIGARTVHITQFLICLFFIITKPMSLVLDCMLGHEVGTVHSRTELMEMLKLQISMGACDEEEGAMAKQVAEGALSFRDKRVGEVMTPLEDAYMLSEETRLGFNTVREIFETGFSRIPVYGRDKHDYRGLLYTKDLMLADP
jgi:metal transporter CNNM